MNRVRVSRTARSDIRQILLHLERERPASRTVEEWLDRLERRVQTLREFPHRCARAPEDEFFPETIRQLLMNPYRILFTVHKEEVWILHVRHQRRRPADEEDLTDLP